MDRLDVTTRRDYDVEFAVAVVVQPVRLKRETANAPTVSRPVPRQAYTVNHFTVAVQQFNAKGTCNARTASVGSVNAGAQYAMFAASEACVD